ncbi:MAG: hypothetical protein ACRDTC_09315 [Pseudonocardiaceae bacterium]
MPVPVVPMARRRARRIVRRYEGLLVQAIGSAWEGWSELAVAAPARGGQVGLTAQAMVVSDFLRDPVDRLFRPVRGVQVRLEYGRPWLVLAGGLVLIRFKKLDESLNPCRSDSDRQTKIDYHLLPAVLPGMPEPTVLTAGYVLDPAGLDITRIAVVCHFAHELLYTIDLAAAWIPAVRIEVAPPLVQLPLTGLSAPVIRSARDAARRRSTGTSGP